MIARPTRSLQRTAGGVLRAFVGSGRITGSIVPFFLVLLCSCATRPGPWYVDGQEHPSLPAEMPFNREAGGAEQLLLTLRSGSGEDWLFMVDTGSAQTILDKSLEPKLGERLETKTVAYGWFGKRTVGIYQSPKLYVGDTQLISGAKVWTDDLSRMVLGPSSRWDSGHRLPPSLLLPTGFCRPETAFSRSRSLRRANSWQGLPASHLQGEHYYSRHPFGGQRRGHRGRYRPLLRWCAGDENIPTGNKQTERHHDQAVEEPRWLSKPHSPLRGGRV